MYVIHTIQLKWPTVDAVQHLVAEETNTSRNGTTVEARIS